MTDPQTDRRARRKAAGRVAPTAEEIAGRFGEPMFDAALEPTAHARASDPETSHHAAKRVVKIGRLHEAVYECLVECGPLADHDLLVAYARGVHVDRWPRQSASGLRTRRCELGDLTPPRVAPTGNKVPSPGGGLAKVWRAVPS